MSRSSALLLGAILTGLVVGFFVAERATAQGRTASASTGWPPPPEHFVNVREVVTTVQDGDVVKIYDVPVDHWLVVTDCRFDVEGYNTFAQWLHLELGEELNGIFTTKIGQITGGIQHLSDRSFSPAASLVSNPVPYVSVTGKVFRPGSRVGIRYTNSADLRNDGFDASVSCNLSGYLIDR